MNNVAAPSRGRGRHARRFGRLWFGFALASSGDGFALGAVPLLAVVVDPHPLAVSVVAAADLLPWLAMALPAGALADRFPRGKLMTIVNLLRGAVLVIAGFLVLGHHMDLALLVLVVFLNASARATYYSSLQAAVPELVAFQSLERANGTLMGTEAAAEHVAGPIIGAATFAASRSLPFFADAAALAFSGTAFARLRTNSHSPNRQRGSLFEGVKLLVADRRLRLLLITLATLAGLQGLVSGVLVLVATKDWGVHPGAYGVFLAAGAIGTVPGALLAERLVARFESALTLLSCSAALGAAYLVMGSSRTWTVAGPAFVVTGFAIGAASVIATSVRQRLTPEELMGRVGAAWRGVVWGAAPVGALAAGSLALVGGLRFPVVLAGALQLLMVVILARPLIRTLNGSLNEESQDDFADLVPTQTPI